LFAPQMAFRNTNECTHLTSDDRDTTTAIYLDTRKYIN